MKKILIPIIVGSFLLISASAFAETYGAVKVECWGRCDLVDMSQICETYVSGAEPVAVACDDTGYGSGWDTACGSATCRPFGTLIRSDLLSAYCDDGPGYDAVVTCRTDTAVAPSAGKLPDVEPR